MWGIRLLSLSFRSRSMSQRHLSEHSEDQQSELRPTQVFKNTDSHFCVVSARSKKIGKYISSMQSYGIVDFGRDNKQMLALTGFSTIRQTR